jgi:hypothetical protein
MAHHISAPAWAGHSGNTRSPSLRKDGDGKQMVYPSGKATPVVPI